MTRTEFSAIAFLLALAALTGCASATYAPIDNCVGPVSTVQVLHAMPKEGTFRRCGTITLIGGSMRQDDGAMEMAITEARRYGANAIVILRAIESQFSVARGPYREGTAIAIRVD